MEKIKLFYDEDESSEVSNEIEFEPVLAGTSQTKELYAKNMSENTAQVRITITGDINKEIQETMQPEQKIKIEMEAEPDKNATKPIKANIQINARYIIK